MGIYKDLNDYEVMYLVEENDETAQDLLFEKYRPIVVKMASSYRNEAKKCGLETDDLIQEGYLGLYSAIKNYNADSDTLFYTYAMLSIRSKILNALRIHNTQKNTCLNQSISLSKPFSSIQDGTLIDLIEDENALLPEVMVQENEMLNVVKSFLFSLNISQAFVFELKLNGFCNADISKLLGCSSKEVSNYMFRIRKKFQVYLSKNYKLNS